MWTSITGTSYFTASPIPTEVCVYAAAFKMIASQEKPTF